jgi:hypothetical protein
MEQNAGQPGPATPLSKEAIRLAIAQKSKLPMEELRRRLTQKLYWIIGLGSAVAILGIIFRENKGMLIGLVLFFSWYLAGFVFILAKVLQLKKLDLNMAENLQSIMKTFYRHMRQALAFEEAMGIAFLPIIYLIGLTLPLFYIGMTIEEMLADTTLVIIGGIGMLIIVPLGIWAGKALTKVAFDGYMERLKYYIQRLEEE